jgi:ankyrin repeat protein
MTCIFRFCSEITHSINRCRAETSLDALDARHWTALVSAARNGHTAVVKLFLDTANLERQSGELALGHASFNGHSQVVKLLLNAGADVDGIGISGASSLHTAVYQGLAEVVDLASRAPALSIPQSIKDSLRS